MTAAMSGHPMLTVTPIWYLVNIFAIIYLLAAPREYHGIYIHIGEGSYFKVGARFEVKVYKMEVTGRWSRGGG